MTSLLPVLFLALGSAVPRAAAAAFLAQGQAKVGGADGALREDHHVYGQIARGQPYDDKSPRAVKNASTYQPLANRLRVASGL